MSVSDLLEAARQARAHAQAPHSSFAVGAAIETADGTIVTGCNIESASLGLTLCAERLALFKALSEGHRTFRAIAVVAASEEPAPPCGACRQLLWEFAGDMAVHLANLDGAEAHHRLAELFPRPFEARLFRADGGRRTLKD